jgi:hypothetical protein
VDGSKFIEVLVSTEDGQTLERDASLDEAVVSHHRRGNNDGLDDGRLRDEESLRREQRAICWTGRAAT